MSNPVQLDPESKAPLDGLLQALPGGFNFSQYLVLDDEPLLFHTGYRAMFPLVREAIAKIMPVENLRHLGFSHFEGDEFGAMNHFLAAAPHRVPPAKIGIEVPVPLRPFAASAGAHLHRCLKTRQRADHAAARRIDGEVDRKPVPVRHGIEHKADHVAARLFA